LLDTTGGTIFCNSAIVVPYSSGAEVTEQIVVDGLNTAGYTSTKAGYLDVAVSTRLADADYTAPTAPDNAGIAAIKAKTDLIPASPASAGEYTAAIAAIPTTPLLAANYTAPDNAGIAALPTLAEIEAATIPVNIKKVNDVTITGAGVEDTDEWRPA